ncbi:MAG: sodium:phosphate symporter [Candidatus Nanohaloarchaea archaeon]
MPRHNPARENPSFLIPPVPEPAQSISASFRLSDSSSLGILSFLTTYAVYIPGTALGFLLLPHVPEGWLVFGPSPELTASLLSPFTVAAERTLSTLGNPVAGFLGGFLLLFLSLRLFDHAFSHLSQDTFRSRWFRFIMHNRWVGFGAGLLVTAATTSVSVSLGVLVPLYNRGYLKGDEMVPYIMGANITTIIDTWVAAVVLGAGPGMSAIVLLMLSTTLFTLLALVFYDRFHLVLKASFDRVLSSRRVFGVFLAVTGIVPLLMLLL